MFNIASDEIYQLNDIDLRELVRRLCEADLVNRGLSTVTVTWGGNRDSADGGLDVRVELPPACLSRASFRSSTGFQVKKPDMPKSKLIAELRSGNPSYPRGLAEVASAYGIIYQLQRFYC